MNKKKLFIIILDAALAVFALLAGHIAGWMIGFLPDCPVASFGLLCPACGGTRCVRYLFSGRFAEAFGVNPFVFLTVIYLGIALVLLNVGILTSHKPTEKAARIMTGWQAVIIFAAAFALFGILRNIW